MRKAQWLAGADVHNTSKSKSPPSLKSAQGLSHRVQLLLRLEFTLADIAIRAELIELLEVLTDGLVRHLGPKEMGTKGKKGERKMMGVVD
jgi:hypothetical protein